MLGEPEGPPEIFPRVQPCSPIVECEGGFLEDISKGMQILVNYPILLTYMVVILIYVLFWVAKEPLCVTHLLVYYSLTEHLRLSYTHLLHTLLNFPLPLNIPAFRSFTNTSRVNTFGRLLVMFSASHENLYSSWRNTILGLVSVYYTEAQGRGSFVKRMDRFCAKLYNLTIRYVQTSPHTSL